MAKMPKHLSLNGHARSTAKTRNTMDWQNRTSERSGTGIIRALVAQGYVNPIGLPEAQQAIMKRIKREQLRIKKALAFKDSPERTEFIARKERVVNRLIYNLQCLNDVKVGIDHRELSKFQTSPRDPKYMGEIESNSIVRLEKGKIALPGKDGRQQASHRNSPDAFFEKVKKFSQEAKVEKVKKKYYAPQIQAEIDKVFVPITEEIDDDEFERMMNE